MSSLKLAYASPVSLALTSANLASSATAGWQSDGQDNTALLYLDALVQFKLAAVNTAPASDKTIYVYAFGVADGTTTDYTGTGAANASGTVGTLTFPDISANNAVVCPLIGRIPYPTQNVAINSAVFSIAKAFGGTLIAKYAVGMLNFSGMTLNVTSIKIVPVYATIA
jgi:hypothetical protein